MLQAAGPFGLRDTRVGFIGKCEAGGAQCGHGQAGVLHLVRAGQAGLRQQQQAGFVLVA